MTENEIELQKLNLEQERLALEKEKAEQDKRFWLRNFGTLITTVVSLTAVLVTAGQLWVAKISKDQELAVASSQKDRELALMQAQRDKELTLLAAQHTKEWNLNAAKFVSENANQIFGRNKEQRERIAKIIIATFPPDITDVLFQKLENIPESTQEQATWRTARRVIIPKIQEPQPPAAGSAPGSLTGQFHDEITGEPIK
jgi:hypothetical protein